MRYQPDVKHISILIPPADVFLDGDFIFISHFDTAGLLLCEADRQFKGILFPVACHIINKTVFEGDYDNVRVTEKDNGEGVITIYVEATTDKIPDVKPEGGSNSGFDVDVDGWGDEVDTDIPIE